MTTSSSMVTPQKRTQHGCFSTFLRVLLCAGNGTSPPVHPSEHFIEESEKAQHSTKEKKVVKVNEIDENASSSTPGVVARLMGLDSLPNPKWVVKSGTPDSVPRSRSVNFVDYLVQFDASHVGHRRVKTSASFREVPGLKGSDGNVFVFCMEGENSIRVEQEGGRNEMKKVEMKFGELRQRSNKKNTESVGVKKERNQGKNKKISKVENEQRRVLSSKNGSKGGNLEAKDSSFVSSDFSKCSTSSRQKSQNGGSSRSRFNASLPNKHKKGVVEAKPKVRKNRRNQKSMLKVESQCNLENQSLVSVVDSNDYPFLYGTGISDGPKSFALRSKWGSPSVLSLGDDDVEDTASTTNEGYSFIDVNKEAEYYSEMMLKLRTLTEQDIRDTDCTSKRVRQSESFEDICLMFEHKIFDHLLYEVVNEVIELY